MKYARPVIVGMSVAAMAAAVGLPSFSGEWWVFMIAANTLATFAGTGNGA